MIWLRTYSYKVYKHNVMMMHNVDIISHSLDCPQNQARIALFYRHTFQCLEKRSPGEAPHRSIYTLDLKCQIYRRGRIE